MRVPASALVRGAFAAVSVFPSPTPSLPRAGIDPPWAAALGEAADRPARFGVDAAFTYGPASPVVTGHLDAAWLTRTLPLPLGFAALFGWCAAPRADGTRRSLWSACFDPGAAPDRAALDEPDGVEELARETSCGGDPCPARWTVGADVEAARE